SLSPPAGALFSLSRPPRGRSTGGRAPLLLGPLTNERPRQKFQLERPSGKNREGLCQQNLKSAAGKEIDAGQELRSSGQPQRPAAWVVPSFHRCGVLAGAHRDPDRGRQSATGRPCGPAAQACRPAAGVEGHNSATKVGKQRAPMMRRRQLCDSYTAGNRLAARRPGRRALRLSRPRRRRSRPA
ncbi:unnamed protein product, partial [Amoebophrya sp. A120]